MSVQVTLREYDSVDVALTHAQAEALQAAAPEALTVGVANRGMWRIKATQHVGSVVVSGVEVLVRPKISLQNLFVLLGVGLRPGDWQEPVVAYDARPDLLRSVAQFFARAVDLAIGAGLVRAYRSEEDRLVSVRGRIDIAAVVRRPGPVLPVPCRFDEYTADIDENRVLKAAIRVLLRVPEVPPATRRALTALRVAFDDVADVVATPATCDAIRFTRLNAHYEPAVRLARLILANLTLTDERGAHRASSFLLDMNVLFEAFLSERLQRALAGRCRVLPQASVYLGEGRRAPMRPDLMFERNGRVIGVADVKYKLANDGDARRSDQYQLLAYTTALDLPAGTLIYAQTTGEAPEKEVVVRHAGKRLRTYPIDLTGSPAAIEAAVSDLADVLLAPVGPGASKTQPRKLASVGGNPIAPPARTPEIPPHQ